jgi:uncharacterized protein (DUF305 family)
MIRHKLLLPAVIAALSVGSIAIAQTTDSSKAYMAVHEKMMRDMMMSPSGDADKDFAMMMVPHHQGAIDMAEIELKYGKDPDLRKMAEKIIHAQKEEIADFKKWLAKHAM